MLEIKILNRSTNPLPAYQTEGAAGMDIAAFLPHPITLKPFERVLIPTGLFLEIPHQYEAQIRPRSGLAIKHGITLPNAPATIDSDYRGELIIPLINLSNQDFIINNNERIAQLIIAKHETVQWKLSDTLTDTKRGSGGFGHTGT